MSGMVIVIIAVVVILFCIGSSSSSTTTPNPKNLPTAAHAKCPFCGTDNPSRTYIPSKEPVPAIFKCGDCLRYYGNTAAMTPEEKRLVEKSNQDCKRVDMMPEKTRVIEAVVNDFKTSRGFSAGDLGMVIIKNGEVKAQRSQGTARLLTTYPYISETADQRLTIMCYNKLKQELPYTNFSFGWGWVSKEK